jgi:hydroxymethylpyrimidine pyrophosphatase-like HAD family hydrolase
VLVFNRSRLMALPTGVNKASGLREALRTLRLSPHNAIAIGDAENDHDLLEACELGVAVAWGSAALQQKADDVLPGQGPNAVAEYIRHAAQGDGSRLNAWVDVV